MAGIKEEKKIYSVGIYCRLSKDDGTENESASIATQKSILTDYVKKQGWHLPFQTGQGSVWKRPLPANQTQSIPAVQFFLQCFKESRRFISGQRDSLSALLTVGGKAADVILQGTTPKQMEDTIIRLLERELQRKRGRDSR